jgi:hypothetical protein
VGPALAENDFATGLGKWRVAGDPAPGYPQWLDDGGEGIARTVDGQAGATMYWRAPPKYLGDKRAAFRGSLSYSLRQSTLENQFEDDDVILKGDGLRLAHDHPGGGALGGFSGFQLEIVPAEFTKPNGAAPTRRQLKRVLGNLGRLSIRAEYANGPDTDDITDVRLSKPAPS